MARINYTDKDKEKLVSFINKYNAEHGRGGIAQAQQKFGIAFPTLKSWVEAAGNDSTPAAKAPKEKTEKVPKAAKAPKAPKAGKSGRPAKAKTAAKTETPAKAVGNVSNEVISRMNKISDYQSQIESLRDLIEQEKAAIHSLI